MTALGEPSLDLWLTADLAMRTFGVLLFAYAAASKLRNFSEFESIVARYMNMALPAARPIAAIVVGAEVTVVALLLLPEFGSAGAALAAALLSGFGLAMARALARGERELDCGCMRTALRQRVRWPLVVRNFVLAALFAPLFWDVPSSIGNPFVIADGLASGGLLFMLNLVFGYLVALDDSFADLKRRYG